MNAPMHKVAVPDREYVLLYQIVETVRMLEKDEWFQDYAREELPVLLGRLDAMLPERRAAA